MNAIAPRRAPDNGTPRVLVETSRALPLVSLTVSEHAGAIDDPAGKEGLARFVARLMRRTGGGLTLQQLDTRIDSLGAALSADATQSTTGFHGTVISRSLEPFVDLLIDVLARPGFSADEHGRLQREIQSDLVELRDNDRALAQRWFRRKLFVDHAYGRSAGGTIASVSSISSEDVTKQHARSVCSNNLVFALAGDIDADAAARIAERICAELPPGARRNDALGDPQPVPGRRLVLVDKPERTQTQIFIGGLGTHPRDADHIPLHVANTVFGGTFTARMTREIRSKRGWSYGAYSSLPCDRHRQAFSMWTFPKAEDAAPCIRLEIELLEAWRERGITARELAWAKRYLTRSHAFAVDTAQKRAALALDEEIYDLPAGYYAEYIDRTSAVTLDQANQAVRDRISSDDLLIVVVGTASEIGDAVRDAIPGLAQTEVVPFDEDV